MPAVSFSFVNKQTQRVGQQRTNKQRQGVGPQTNFCIISKTGGGQKKSDVMVAAVTARIASTPKTPTHTVVARPTSAVKPLNITSKVVDCPQTQPIFVSSVI